MHALAFVLIPRDTSNIEQTVARLLTQSHARQAIFCRKQYLGAKELRQMRLGLGSPLLAAVLKSSPESLECWTPTDPGVDKQGIYEFVPAPVQTRWDSWCIGGHWDGLFHAYERDAGAFGDLVGSVSEMLQTNICLVSCLPLDIFAWIVVSPDGQWHEGVWWNREPQEREDWHQEFLRLLRCHADCLAVAVDCHL